ncbi:hypothetical protein ATO7_10597 [Oceanococcus atlanticus]|uniref:Polyhydroxybutyrate depolymerase n=1 Tax=Oceanococcus atlanticus TaxID=1317117 RepID=A0A1Y1SEQ2_9GAMM|nr:PHB depolymerase family esterase [Oceanococcus atlanticus]ORE87485.1 hypothetical protein ATO7_10597 [Oceanococcus atlanticus]
MRFKLASLTLAAVLAACAMNAPPAKAQACDGQAKPGMHEAEMDFGMLDRSYKVYVPKNWDEKTRRPLVLGLHGGFGTGQIFNEQTRAAEQADKYNMLLVLPDGRLKSWNAGTCCGAAAKFGVRDVDFIEALVEAVSAQYCVDKSKVFATGFSNGAMLSHRVACEKPGLLKAIAPVSGGIMSECKNGSAVSALLIQGRDDPRIFWNGGTFDDTYRPSMREVVSALARRNGCAEQEKAVSKSATGVECRQRTGCDGHPITYCGVDKVGHQWPGGKSYWVDELGPNTRAFDATAEIFKFFADQAR